MMDGQPYILIVDDEADLREIFSAQLSAAGYRIETAENGEIALQKMAAERPDLVLMDVRMPVMDGPSTVLKMRENPALQNIRVLFLTSLGDPRSEMKEISKRYSEDFGAQGYIKKTDDLSVITEEVQKILS